MLRPGPRWRQISKHCPLAKGSAAIADYAGCRYDKGGFTCAEPDHIDTCPVPRPRLRNGRLNQTAYSLFLFVRDIAGGNLIGWIDSQLEAATGPSDADLEVARQEALIGPLRGVFGVADKVLTMALSTAAPAVARSIAALFSLDTARSSQVAGESPMQ